MSGGSSRVALMMIVAQNSTNSTAAPNMPISLPKNTLSSGTAAARISITLFERSSAMVPTAWPERKSVRKNIANTPIEAAWPRPLGEPWPRFTTVLVTVLVEAALPSFCARRLCSASCARNRASVAPRRT